MENQNQSIEKETEIKYKYISMIENGNLNDPSPSIIKEIFDLFNLKIPNSSEN